MCTRRITGAASGGPSSRCSSTNASAAFRQMIAVIGDNLPASIALHRAAGFEHVGRLRAVGHKFGRWCDTTLMQRPLGAGDDTPP